MSSASDPLDQAFPDTTIAPTPLKGDPLDAAYPDEKPKTKFTNPQGKEVTEGPLGFVNGVAEIAGKTVANIPYNAARGVVDLYRRVVKDGDPSAPEPSVVTALRVPLSENARNVAESVGAAKAPGFENAGPSKDYPGMGPLRNDPLYQKVAPIVEDIASIAPAAGAARNVSRAFKTAIPADEIPSAAQSALDKTYSGQSMGAAGTAPNVASLSPDLQKAVAEASRKTGGIVNPDALTAHIEASEHGVDLMRGAATRDPDQWSEEYNSTHSDIVARKNANETQMIDAMDKIRRDASPSHVANSARENGQIVLNDLKNFDEPRVQAINDAYKAANDANEAAGKGALTLDPKAAVSQATRALEDREELLPSPGRSILQKIRDAAENGQQIPLKKVETWKTIISDESRKADRAADGSAVKALSDLRDSIEQMSPGSDAAAGVQEKFNAARSLARQRFQDMDADPAYKAAVNDSVPKGHPSPLADTFLDDYALSKGAPKSQIDLMRSKLSEEGQGALASHTLNTIRNQAIGKTGKITPAGFNGALQKYGDKLPSLVAPETQDSLASLARTVERVKSEPPGGTANFTKSGIVARDAMNAIEGLANVKTSGAFGYLKDKLNLSENKFARDALKPGAGLEDLKTTP
jgi:hypothetical protein